MKPLKNVETIGHPTTVFRTQLAHFWPLVNTGSPMELTVALKKAASDYLLLTGDGIVLSEERQKEALNVRPVFGGREEMFEAKRRVAKIVQGDVWVYDVTVRGWAEPEP